MKFLNLFDFQGIIFDLDGTVICSDKTGTNDILECVSRDELNNLTEE